MVALTISESRPRTPDGALFVKRWLPAGPAESAPIILLHDSLGSVELWRDFPAELASATARPVIAYDRLGFGRSDPNPHVLGHDFIRDEARAGLAPVRAALGVNRMILLGHSVGGGMAIAGGAAFRIETEAVISLSAQSFVEDRTLAGLEEAKRIFEDPQARQRLARYHGEKVDWILDAWLGTWLAPGRADWTLNEDLRRLQAPLLALHGDADDYGSLEHARRMKALAGGSVEMVELAQCGHVPHREKPGDVVRLIADFVRSLPHA